MNPGNSIANARRINVAPLYTGAPKAERGSEHVEPAISGSEINDAMIATRMHAEFVVDAQLGLLLASGLQL